jgi:hypothetical protein
LIAPTPVSSAAPPDARAEEIFARTRAAFAARTFPSELKYGIRISGLRDGTWTGRTYDAYEAWPEGTVDARSISEEEAANPVRPPTFCFFGLGAPKRAGLELPGILGFPKLAITYAFGLAHPPRDGETESVDTSLKTIAMVRAVSRKYDVRLVHDEDVDGYPCWHLTLTPLGNPGTYRVRDLWVDKSSYQTRLLVTDGNFTGKETRSGRWTVSYAQDGTSWYLSREISEQPVNDETGRFDRVAVEFINVVADPHENLDFGISGSSKDIELEEPAD